MELSEAQGIGRVLQARVKGAVARVEVAGSVRRLKPAVKDIELVAIVNDYDALYRALAPAGRFIKPGVPGAIDWPPKPNARYVRMLLNEGVKLDLFIATPVNWGGIYVMRTGSGVGPDGSPYTGFVPMMFARWKRVSGGGRMRGGQPALPCGRMIPVPEEADFFSLCKARWIPADERTDASAIRPLKEG